MKKLAFVTPWYGETIAGGAEMELRGLVHHLQDAGTELEVLTTCAAEFRSDWNQDAHPAGETVEAGICVRRFPVRKGDRKRFDALNHYLLQGVRLTRQEESEFLYNSINSDELYNYIRSHQAEYEWFVFIPYLYGTTYEGVLACPEKALMIPCLHDECYAEMDAIRRMIQQLAGIIFHAKPEKNLANRLYDMSHVRQAVLGEGIDTDWTADAGRFRSKYAVGNPFLLYAGRKDATKNVDTLLRYFARYKAERADSQLQLVMIGPASLEIPEAVRADVHDLGFVPIQDKYDAYAAAFALCQPSKNESFSLVMMESWLAGRPVLVHQACAVTSNFVCEANGGFYFANYMEFAEQLDYLLLHPQTAEKLGAQGRQFVRSHFSWDVIVKCYLEFFEHGGVR